MLMPVSFRIENKNISLGKAMTLILSEDPMKNKKYMRILN